MYSCVNIMINANMMWWGKLSSAIKQLLLLNIALHHLLFSKSWRFKAAGQWLRPREAKTCWGEDELHARLNNNPPKRWIKTFFYPQNVCLATVTHNSMCVYILRFELNVNLTNLIVISRQIFLVDVIILFYKPI